MVKNQNFKYTREAQYENFSFFCPKMPSVLIVTLRLIWAFALLGSLTVWAVALMSHLDILNVLVISVLSSLFPSLALFRLTGHQDNCDFLFPSFPLSSLPCFQRELFLCISCFHQIIIGRWHKQLLFDYFSFQDTHLLFVLYFLWWREKQLLSNHAVSTAYTPVLESQ